MQLAKNVRVHELAKEMGLDPKVILDLLAQAGRPDATPMSALTPEAAEVIRRRLSRMMAQAAQRQASEAPAAEAEPARDGGREGEAPRTRAGRQAAGAAASHRAADGGAARPAAQKGAPGRAGGQRQGGKGPPTPRRGEKDRGAAARAAQPSAARTRRPEPGSRGKLEIPDTILVKDLAGRIGVPASAI